MSAPAPRERPVILITGSSGQIGYELLRTLAPLGQIVAPDSRELDVTDELAVNRTVERLRPRLIANAAAYTAVDRAEVEQERCFAVNAHAPAVLARAAAAVGALLVHYSTDYVFDGGASAPYREDAPTAPSGVYGASKLAGERAVARESARHLIVRTSWVYGARGTNFVRTIRRVARERSEVRVVNDQSGAPTWCRTIAEATAIVAAQCLAAGVPADGPWGIYHMTAAGCTTWYEFAQTVVEHFRRVEALACRSVAPISTADYGAPAPRPSYSCLDNTKLEAAFGVALPPWQQQLALALQDFPAA